MVRTIAVSDMAGMTDEVLGTSDWFLVDQERVDRFAEVTGDALWIHVDVERARREMGGTIVHGCLTQSLIPMFSMQIWAPTGYSAIRSVGSDKTRYITPVPVGKRLRMTATLRSVDATESGVRVLMSNVIEIEGEPRPACVADSVTWFQPEGPAA